MKILIVDDEPDVAAVVAMGINYQRPDYLLTECYGGAEALTRIASDPPDLVILDLAMPPPDGFAVLRTLRKGQNDVPVIVLTAKGSEHDRVRGLELGADDYVVKPFSHKELVARLDAVLRRTRAAADPSHANTLRARDLRIDFAGRQVSVAGRDVPLTPTEYNLLFHLATNAGRVMTHEQLLARVWGDEYRDEAHYLKVYVARLRAKLERDPAHPEHILTARGVGYRFPAA